MSEQITIRLAVGLVGMLLAGCEMQSPVQRAQNTPPEPQNAAPMMVDQAMQVRDWDRSTAYYGNGNVIAGPTGFLFEPAWGQPEWMYALEETPLFLLQTAALPVTLTITPPWTPVLYSGVTIAPTYTAMPALPGRAASPELVPMVPSAARP